MRRAPSLAPSFACSPATRRIAFATLGSLASCGAATSLTPIAWAAAADHAERPAHMVNTVFFVAKSENRNQVHYGVRLDASCAPADEAPVFAYWRMLEHGRFATEPLLSREVGAYGFAGQRVLDRTATGGRVLVTLAALRSRPIVVETSAVGAVDSPGGRGGRETDLAQGEDGDRAATGKCVATAHATIGGVPATLNDVFVQLRWPFGVDYLLLQGSALGGRPVSERVSE